MQTQPTYDNLGADIDYSINKDKPTQRQGEDRDSFYEVEEHTYSVIECYPQEES